MTTSEALAADGGAALRHLPPALAAFSEIWLFDFEFIPKPGEHVDVVCLVAHELRSGRTLRLWRDQLTETPPYRVDDGALFVCFVASAECSCHLALGWPLPAQVLDLSPEFRSITSGVDLPGDPADKKGKGKKGLIAALRYYGLETVGAKYKDAMQKRVLEGWPFTDKEREQILKYCESDVVALQRLLPKMLPSIDLPIALYRSEFSGPVSALMEFRGVPIDMEVFGKLQDKRTWTAVRDAMVPAVDAQYGFFERDRAGGWAFRMKNFEAYLKVRGIEWPRLESGLPDLKQKTLDNMTKVYPELEAFRQLRYTRNKMKKIGLTVGRDGRNRTVLWPFVSKTARTQPKAAEWIFSPAVWLRSLIKPEPGTAVAYIDYSSMEFMIAAALSDGHCLSTNAMLELYRSCDPYLNFSKSVGAVPKRETRETPWVEDARDKYKVMLLAVQYGMSYLGLAARLGVSQFEAYEMLNQHKGLFVQYWRWSEDWTQAALQSGKMWTALGWTHRTGVVEFNTRSIQNWPIQSTGSEVLRVACIMATRRGIRLLAPVHDAVLIEAPIDRIEADVALMQEIMRRASRVVLGCATDGQPHEIRTEAKIISYPNRYTDKRGMEVWEKVLELLDDRGCDEDEKENCRKTA
jgi:DNA polymerase I